MLLDYYNPFAVISLLCLRMWILCIYVYVPMCSYVYIPMGHIPSRTSRYLAFEGILKLTAVPVVLVPKSLRLRCCYTNIQTSASLCDVELSIFQEVHFISDQTLGLDSSFLNWTKIYHPWSCHLLVWLDTRELLQNPSVLHDRPSVIFTSAMDPSWAFSRLKILWSFRCSFCCVWGVL